MTTEHEAVLDDLDALIAGDEVVMARHADHLAGCDACRDAKYEAAQVAKRARVAGDLALFCVANQ